MKAYSVAMYLFILNISFSLLANMQIFTMLSGGTADPIIFGYDQSIIDGAASYANTSVSGLDTIDMIGMIGDWKKDPPIYERYFLGGGDSVRGFPYRSIGPVDRNKDNYGGDFMYLLTSELTHPIYDFIRGAIFVDIGDATSSRFGPFNKPNIGIGYGLRIKLPVVNAPIKLDLAFPVLNNQKGVKNSLRFHFNMGFSVF